MSKADDIVRAIWRRLDKSERWQALDDVRSQLSEGLFLKTFVRVWVDSEGNDLHRPLIDSLIDEYDIHARRVMPLLLKADQKFYRELPEQVQIYRGTSMETPYGDYSWTTDRDQAVWFANRVPNGTPALAEGSVHKDWILFATKSRGESEIAVQTVVVDNLQIKAIGPKRDDPMAALFFMVHQHPVFHKEMFEAFAETLMISGLDRDAAEARIYSDLNELASLGFKSAVEMRRKSILKVDWDRVQKKADARKSAMDGLR